MSKPKNQHNKQLPAANKEVAEKLRGATNATMIEMLWKSILRTGTYIALLEAEIGFFDELKVQPIKALVNDQIIHLKRYQLRIASLFAQNDREVVDILTQDMTADNINDIGEVIDLMKQFNNTQLFVQVVKQLTKLTTDTQANQNIFKKVEEILGNHKK